MPIQLRIDEETFDHTLERIKGVDIQFGISVPRPVDNRVNNYLGRRGLYWNGPEARQWEILTVSCARRPE